ncbi:MAG: hypothetical protein ACKVT2_16420 [Saprospiraceae bacterium]
MKNLFFLLIMGLIFVTSCKYEHEITDPCALHPNDDLSKILIGEWNMEHASHNPAVLDSPDIWELWNLVAEIPDLILKSDGMFESGNENGSWKADEKAQTLRFDYAQTNKPDHILNIFSFNRCYFVYQDTVYGQGLYFLALKH